MRQIPTCLRRIFEGLSVVVVLLFSPVMASAISPTVSNPPSAAVPTGLSIAQIKITGDEFVVLHNNSSSAISDLSNYWLYAFNNVSPLSPGASSSQQQLPAVTLDAGQELLLSASTRNTCGAEIAGKLSLSLTDSGGFLQIVQLGQDANGAVQQKSGDVVSWSSKTGSGIIGGVSSSDPAALYYRDQVANGYGWQLADSSGVCQLNVVVAGGSSALPVSGLAASNSVPPVTIISVSSDTNAPATPVLPSSDIGLSAPQLNEVLPNPSGTDNDDTDEFIELYNPNDKPFDLTGFALQTGLTAKHSYIFPGGTVLPNKAFVAFYSVDTGLSLSNTSGQVALLDPFGTAIGKTDPYSTAKDGMAWAYAKGAWFWTSDITPGAANSIKQPITTKKPSTKASSSKSKSGTGVKGANTSKSNSLSSNTMGSKQATNVTPIHPWTLAVVAALAVAYGIYEYRLDLANRFYEFKRHRSHRDDAGLPATRR